MSLLSRFPIVFGSESLDLGGFKELIAPSAVDRSLRENTDVVALRNHDSNMPLGRRSARTLTLEKQPRGLLATVDVNPNVSFAADLLEMVQRQDAPGGSFAFTVIDDVWDLRNGVAFRTVVDMHLREVSFGVPWPAYPATAARAELVMPSRGISLALAERIQKTALAR